MFADLPIEIIGEIAGKSRLAYHPLVLAYPAFARSLTLGDRLDFAENFGYDCQVRNTSDLVRIEWYHNGKHHRTDGPAIEYINGSKEWYANGNKHRINGPAIDYVNGYKAWYANGKRHRIDGPAIEDSDGSKSWYIDGKLHREGGPAIECTAWYSEGKRHRTDAPTGVQVDGYKTWYIDGKLHRLDGPAIDYNNGIREWYIGGEQLTEAAFAEAIAKMAH